MKDATFDALNEGQAAKEALGELQAYVDERARGLSVPGRGAFSEIERRAAMKEAMEIGMYIAGLIKRRQG